MATSNTKTLFSTDTRGIYREDSSATPDGIFTTTVDIDGTPTIVTRQSSGILSASEAGIFANGTNQSARLTALAANSNVKGIFLDTIGGAEYVFNSDVTLPEGFQVMFYVGNKITGSGTFNGGLLIAPKRQHIFDTTFTCGMKPIDGEFSAMWYGANQGGDDTEALQKMADTFVAYTSNFSNMFLPGGNYTISNGIVFFKGVGGNPTFISFDLYGEKSAYSDDQNVGMVTRIDCTHNDNFAIGIMRGKGCRVYNLYGVGQNTGLNSYSPDIVFSESASFVTNGCSDIQTAPYSFLAIDPFGESSIAPEGRYPRMSAYYTVTTGAGSTDIKIDGVKARYFVCGSVVSPSGSTQNGEALIYNRCWFDYNKVSLATCDPQNRTVKVYDMKCWGPTKYMFSGADYGSQIGAMPEVCGVNIAGSVKYLFNDPGYGTSTTTFINVFAESLYSLGGCFTGNSGNFSFVNCIIKFQGAVPGQSNLVPIILRGNSANFIGTYLQSYGGVDGGLTMDVNYCSFVGASTIKRPIKNTQLQDIGDYFNVSLASTTTSQSSVEIRDTNTAMVNGGDYVLRNSKILESTPNNFYSLTREEISNANTLPGVGISANVTIDDTNKQYSFNAGGDAGRLNVGDNLYIYNAGNDYGVINRFTSGGYVASKDGNIITVAGLPQYLTDGTYAIYSTTLPKTNCFYVGDIVNGSPVITNVLNETSVGAVPFPVGSPIVHPLFPTGTYCVSSTSTTITASMTATGPAISQAIVSWNYRQTAVGRSPYEITSKVGYQINDIILNNKTNSLYDNIDRWVCTKAGITNSANLPTFSPVYFGAIPNKLTVVSDSDYTLVDTDVSIIFQNLSSNRTFTIPAASAATNRLLYIKLRTDGGYQVNFTQSILVDSGSTTAILNNNDFIIQSDGSNWYLVSQRL